MNQSPQAEQSKAKKVSPKYWLWAAGVIFVAYMTVYPTVQSMLKTSDQSESGIHEVKDITVDELIMLRSTEAFLTLWFFAFGATVGSFLNVVVYRTPRGESLLKKGSTCPTCGSKIPSKDNIPILGWIWLEGKCRACQFPISSRYPIVEAVTGVLFSLFFFVELLSGGQNLPERIPNAHSGFVWVLLYPKWDLIGLYVYHCLLPIALLTWALIVYDKQRVRLRSYVTTFCMALLPLLIWPRLLLISHQTVLPSSWKPEVSEALVTAAIGASIGFAVGFIIAYLLKDRNPEDQPRLEREFAMGLALLGMMLGWQAALSAACGALAIRFVLVALSKLLNRPLYRWPLTGALVPATVIQLCLWRIIAENLSDWWPVTGFFMLPLAISGVVMLTLIGCNFALTLLTHNQSDFAESV